MNETCGYCGGSGIVYGSCYSRDGHKDHETPPRLVCEYCGGSGCCAGGSTLLAARPPVEEDGPVNAGLPPWA